MGIFGGITDVNVKEQRGVYLKQGSYELVTERCRINESKVGNGTYFIAEFTVKESNSDSAPAGTRASWVVDITKFPQLALADIKSFTVCATGAEEHEVDESFMESLVDGAGDLVAGRQVHCNVEEVPTKKGGTFSKHYWSFSGEQDN